MEVDDLRAEAIKKYGKQLILDDHPIMKELFTNYLQEHINKKLANKFWGKPMDDSTMMAIETDIKKYIPTFELIWGKDNVRVTIRENPGSVEIHINTISEVNVIMINISY